MPASTIHDPLTTRLRVFETMTGPSSSSSPAVKRACDACHRRKVKCIGDGTRPCKNCSSSGLTCTYNSIPQKKGPKGSRAKVISELRETQRQSQLSAPSHGVDSPPISPPYGGQPGILSMELITTCVDFFFANMFPTMPILHRQKVGETIGQMETDPEAYCLIVSLCGYMLIQPNMELRSEASDDVEPRANNIALDRMLLADAMRTRRKIDYLESPSVWSVIISFFFFGSYFCLDLHGTAWFHLREATTLALTMGMHDETTYHELDAIEGSRRRRLYWYDLTIRCMLKSGFANDPRLLFVTERAYALQQHKPLTLQAVIGLPTIEDDPAESTEVNGFLHLVKLFRPFDETFVGVWNKARTGCTSDWLATVQQQLSDALPAYLKCTESQAVDLRCSQQWLRTMVWQLSIGHGFLSSAAADNAMSFKFPVELSRDLLSTTAQFSQQAMEIHGIGLVEKLFDISCTLIDVMSCVPLEQHTFEFGSREYLHQMMSLISNLRGGQQRYMPLLISKIHETMPNTGYAIPFSMPSSSTLSVNHPGSGTSGSGGSTPFGSPPLSALETNHSPYGFQREHGMAACTSAPSYSSTVVTTGMEYGHMTASTSIQMFPDPAIFHGPAITKFEPDG